jgi:hypothetical protein
MKPRSRLFTLLAACTIAGGVALAPGGVANAAPRNLPPVSQDDLNKALQCGLSAGLLKLKNGGPEAQDLYNAIKVTLVGRDLALNRLYLLKAAIQFGLAWVPLEEVLQPNPLPAPGRRRRVASGADQPHRQSGPTQRDRHVAHME